MNTFSWMIEEAATWPPPNRPAPPFGPTTLEIMRSCPLRGCFEASPGYERRLGYAARIGNAFHRAAESLSKHPPATPSPQQAALEARDRFLQALDEQEAERALHPREKDLPRDEDRINRAIEAIMLEARRLHGTAGAPPGAWVPPAADSAGVPTTTGVRPVEVEHNLFSRDRLFVGRIDRAERSPEGIQLIDYKSAVRDDVPGRYQRQLQIYAFLWHEAHGVWPSTAYLIYPLIGTVHPVNVAPELCAQVVNESRQLIAQVQRTPDPAQLATPGETCKVCDFRPWCRPFWNWQTAETRPLAAQERAGLGFEATITDIEHKGDQLRILSRWRDTVVRMVVAAARFPHLLRASPGMRIRAIDMRMRGLPNQLQAVATDFSEIFLLE
jgi:RecB family exonuclease